MIAYFDCFSGISGDMTLGALFDLGVPVKWLQESLQQDVPLPGFDLSVEPVQRHGITGRRVRVRVNDGQADRNYNDIKRLIGGSRLSDFVKKTGLDMFERIADAEACIHGCPKAEVHFHEVGGVDALVDILGTALGIEFLGIKKVMASKIPLGTGFVSSDHGRLPVPAPATLAILTDVPVYGSGIDTELVTPTGAAIVTALAESFGPMPVMKVRKIGYGAGRRDLNPIPNLLRIVNGDVPAPSAETVVMVETCIDDMNPEIFGFIMDRLFEDGALDVYWVPIFMKKNRPGTMIQVLCRADAKEAVARRILMETTTAGIRYYDVHRQTLERKQIQLKTPFGEIPVKQIKNPDGTYRIVPEYEICRQIATEKDIPIREVYENIIKENAGRDS